MKVQRIGGWGGPIHVFPDDAFAKPLAGPFASESAARGWVVEHVERGLSPAKLELWREVCAQLPAPTDYGIELALIGLIAHGVTLDKLAKYIPRAQLLERRVPAAQTVLPMVERREVPDHRLAASGERP